MSRVTRIINAENKDVEMAHLWKWVEQGIAAYGEIQISIGQVIKTYIQQAKYHAMISDIAKTVVVGEKPYSLDVWKAKLVVDFEAELDQLGEPLTHKGEWTMSLRNQFPIYLRPSTVKLTKPEAAKFIEYLYVTGIDYGATFSEKSVGIYEEYQQLSERKQAA